MSIVVICICGQQFKADDKDAGKRTLCPHCGKVLTVPRPKAESDLAPASTPMPGGRRGERARRPAAPGGRGGGGRPATPGAGSGSAPRGRAPAQDDPNSLAGAASAIRAERGPAGMRSRKPSGPGFWVIFGGAGMVLILFVVMVSVLLSAGGNKLGHSVNTITKVTGSSYSLEGHKLTKAGRDLSWDPGAVLIVGIPQGVTLGGNQYEYGAIVIVQDGGFRRASPNDRIVFDAEMTIFDKTYPAGPFTVPSGGKLNAPPPKTAAAKPGGGNMQGGTDGGGGPVAPSVRWSDSPVAVLSFAIQEENRGKDTPPPMTKRDYDGNMTKADAAELKYQGGVASQVNGDSFDIYLFKEMESGWPGDSGGWGGGFWGKRKVKGGELEFDISIAGEHHSDGSLIGTISGRISGLRRDYAFTNVKFIMVPQKPNKMDGPVPTTNPRKTDF